MCKDSGRMRDRSRTWRRSCSSLWQRNRPWRDPRRRLRTNDRAHLSSHARNEQTCPAAARAIRGTITKRRIGYSSPLSLDRRALPTSTNGVSRSRLQGLVDFAKRWFGIIVDVVSRSPEQPEFVVQPQRRKIERTFGWLDWSRILRKEYERTTESSESNRDYQDLWCLLTVP